MKYSARLRSTPPTWPADRASPAKRRRTRVLRYLSLALSLSLQGYVICCAVPALAQNQAPATRAAINVKDADISTILKVFSKRTKRNFILDERVKGTVTMYIPGDLGPEDSQRILDTVLALKGFTTVPVGDNLWKVIPSKEARQSTIPIVAKSGGGDPASTSVMTKLLRLKHITAKDIQPLLAQLISPDGLISAYEGANSLILIDYRDNIDRLTRLVNALDIPFHDQDMTIIPITHADAVDVAEKLKELLGAGEESEDPNQSDFSRIARRRFPNMPPGTPPAATNAAADSSQLVNVSMRSRAPKMIADERTNSVIVVADEETTTRIRGLIEELDSKVDRSSNRFYVYRCQHANAEEIANVLSGLVGGGVNSPTTTGTTSGSGLGNSGLGSGSDSGLSSSGGLSGRSSRGNRTQDRLSRTSRAPGQPRQNSGNLGSVSSVQLGEDVSITADPSTNSLVINSSKADYEKILSLLKELDIKRRQVLVEAMILEVGVDASAALGVDFTTATGGSDGGVLAQSNFGGNNGLTGLLSNPAGLSGFSVAAASAGTITLPGDIVIPSQAILLNAAKTNSNVNVLSAPTLLATDNEEAEIVVGQNVPFLASTSTSDVNLNNTFNQIDRQDVGITLRITPQINSNDFVTLRMFTDVSSVVESADAELGPTTTVRSSETTVITKDGQMIVIGGLMADTVNDSESGVPFLMDIPIIGQAFRRTTDRRQRTNLLTFITPRIVRDQYDARDATLEQKKGTERVIKEYGHYPSRENVLKNERMNQVTELREPPRQQPGTIKPPTQASEGTPPVQPPQSTEAMPEPTRSIPSTIDLEVAPILPSLPSSLSQQPRSQVNTTGDFVVLRFGRIAESTAMQMPFQPSEAGLLGVQIPAGSGPGISQFFVAGSQYSYKLGEKSVPVEVVGRYRTQPQANEDNQLGPANWHVLSPFEVMNIGRTPWQAR